MKTRAVGTTGIEKNRMDFQFIQAGKTTRDEVVTKLTWIDTGLEHQRLFWGRWYRSSSEWVDIAGPLILDSIASRRWGDRNLLVEFNERGTVERTRELSDSKLNEELGRWLEKVGEPPLNLSEPLVIEMRTGPSSKSMTLSDDLLQVVLSDGGIFRVPRKDIRQLKILDEGLPSDSSWGGDIPVVFGFSHEKVGSCKCLLVNVSPADYLTLLRYVPHAATHR